MCLAIPMKVIELSPPDRAVVEAGDVSLEISLMFVGNVTPGDYVLVHAGFALEIMDSSAAEETLSMLNEITQNIHDDSRGC